MSESPIERLNQLMRAVSDMIIDSELTVVFKTKVNVLCVLVKLVSISGTKYCC